MVMVIVTQKLNCGEECTANNIGREGALQLIELIRNNKTLTELDLWGD
jgi:hypothetical protein